jgi:oligopeptidase B
VDESAPYKRGNYFYYYRYVEEKEYPIYARREGSLDAPEQVLLDVNALAGDAAYFAVRGFSVSPDHKIAAYGVDTRGRRFYELFFLDLKTGELLPDRIEDTTANFEWANDSRTILYGALANARCVSARESLGEQRSELQRARQVLALHAGTQTGDSCDISG